MRKIFTEELNTNAQDIFYVGCKGDTYNLASQNFKGYKEFNKLTIESSAFGSSSFEYALSYAIQYSKKDNPGIIVAFKLPSGKRFFELKNTNDYKKLGLPEELAQIFKTCESYFAINLNVDGHRVKAIPPEFKFAQQILRLKNPKKTIEEILFSQSDESQFNQIDNQSLKNIYLDYIESTFEKIAKQSSEKTLAAEQLKTLKKELFSSKEEIYTKLGIKIKRDGANLKVGNSETAPFDSSGNYIGTIFIRCYPKDIEDTTYFKNFSLLFKDNGKSYPIDAKSMNLINAYMLLFKLLNKYIQNNYSDEKDNAFCNGIRKIKERLLQKVNSENDEGTHVYIDLIQFVFFTILTLDSLPDGSENPFIGVYSPEFKGYSEIHHASSRTDSDGNFTKFTPYGYSKEIDANTIYSDDKTIIITKPILDDIECYGYSIDQFVDIQYTKTNNKETKDGQEDYIKTKIFYKVPPKYLSHLIDKILKVNPKLSIEAFKKNIDKLLSFPSIKNYHISQNYRENKGIYTMVQFIIVKKDNPIIDWIPARFLIKKKNMNYEGLRLNDGSSLSMEDILNKTKSQYDINNILVDKHPPINIVGGPAKNQIGDRIIDLINEYQEFKDLRNIEGLDLLRSISNISSNEGQLLLQKLPLSDDIRGFLTKVKDGNQGQASRENSKFLLSIGDLNGAIDANDGSVIQVDKTKGSKDSNKNNQTSKDNDKSATASDLAIDQLIKTVRGNKYNVQFRVNHGEENLRQRLQLFDEFITQISNSYGKDLSRQQLKDEIVRILIGLKKIRINKIDSVLDKFFDKDDFNSPKDIAANKPQLDFHEQQIQRFKNICNNPKSPLYGQFSDDLANGYALSMKQNSLEWKLSVDHTLDGTLKAFIAVFNYKGSEDKSKIVLFDKDVDDAKRNFQIRMKKNGIDLDRINFNIVEVPLEKYLQLFTKIFHVK